MAYVSPVNHPESHLSGSTIESMIDRHVELGLGYFACTDVGNLKSIIRGYNYANKKNIKFIAGVELLFKDPDCDITKDTPSKDFKYSRFVVHAKDQETYQAIVKLVSATNRPRVEIYEESLNLYNWSDLKYLSTLNVTLTTADVEDIVVKHLLVNRPDLAEQYFVKLKDMFGPDKYWPAVVPYKQDKYWQSIVKLKAGGLDIEIPADNKVETNKWHNAKADELNKRAHTHLKAIYLNGIRYQVKENYQLMSNVQITNRFESMRDVQEDANKFIVEMVKKYSMQQHLLLSNYSYYSSPEDKVVQDMKLGGAKRIYQEQHIRSLSEVEDYVLALGVSPTSIVENSKKWTSEFDDFKLIYSYRLPKTEVDPKSAIIERIKQVGRMKWNDERYVSQFREELNLLTGNGVIDLIPYFLPIIDIYDYYSKNGHLTGPGRGSAGGFLISYLIGITHIDPIKYGLSSSRFLTIDRVQSGNIPDIDCDLDSRVPLVGKDGNSGYLFNKYGNRAAQVSTRTLLRIKSAILDANRFVNGGSAEKEIEALSKSLPNTPQGVSDQDFVFGYEQDGTHVDGLIDLNKDLQKYSEERPKEWNIVKRALSLSRQDSRHACFAGDTLINSRGKVVRIKNNPEYAVNKPIKTWSSGVKNTIIVSFNNGVSIRCTPDHKFMVGEEEVEAEQLIGKEVSYKPFILDPSGKEYDMDFAFALGWFLNDGAYIKSANRFEFYFTPDKDDEAKDRVLNWLTSRGLKTTQAKDRADTYRSYNLPVEFTQMQEKTYNKRLPDFFWDMNFLSQTHFMKGLFSANGYCLNTRSIVGIKLSSKLLISDISLWLNANNIDTSCSYSKPKETKHSNGIYISKSTAALTIPHGTNKADFKNLVGFEQSYKAKRLEEIISNANDTKYEKGPTKCLCIEKADPVEVFDFNEPLESVGYISGVLVHNCAYIISDGDIEETVPVMEIGGVRRVTQPTHKDCEDAGLIKYDFLVVSALKDINLCVKYINKKNGDVGLNTGYFTHNGEQKYIWDLPHDPEVFKMLSKGKTETVFQLNSSTATQLVRDIKPGSILDCAVITSLGRPGPLDFVDQKTGRNMAQEYAYRKRGESKGDLEVLNEMLPETYGVLVFQEGVTKLAKELAGMSVVDSENVRIAVGKKKKKLIDSLRPVFIKGAAQKVGEKTASDIWDMMETFARYGFNKSHAVAYSAISYACAFLKYHYPLEWWAAVLSNAKDKEINEVFYQYIKDMVLPPDINTSTEQMEVDYSIGKIRNKLSAITGLGNTYAKKIVENRPYKDLEDFVNKQACGPALARKLIYVGAMDSLFKRDISDISKISEYEKAVQLVAWKNKLKEYGEKIKELQKQHELGEVSRAKLDLAFQRAKKLKERGPKKSEIPEEYVGVSSKKSYQIKKSVFPTMNMDLITVLKADSNMKIINTEKGLMLTNGTSDFKLLNGEHLQLVDNSDVQKEALFVVPGYIIDSSVFSYSGGTRQALKLIIDSSGYVSEKVIWPDYNTGELSYDPGLKKGAIVYFLYKKKPAKPYTNIEKVFIEEPSILS